MTNIVFLHNTKINLDFFNQSELSNKLYFTQAHLHELNEVKSLIKDSDYVLIGNIQNSKFEFELLDFILKNANYIFLEDGYALCVYNTLGCFKDPKIRNCCNNKRFHTYRNLFIGADLTVFTSKTTQQNYHTLYGKSNSEFVILANDTQQLLKNKSFWNIVFNEKEKTILKDKYKHIFIYKSYGGLGDNFIALPAIYHLKKGAHKITIGVKNNLVDVYKRNTKGFEVIGIDNFDKIDLTAFDKIINLGNYPKNKKDSSSNMVDFPSQHKVKQHALNHYIDVIATIQPNIKNTHTSYPYFTKGKTEKYFTVHPGAGFKLKWWSAKKYAKVITILLQKLTHFSCVIILGPEDPSKKYFENIKRVSFELGDLNAVENCLKKSSFHIGNDSGITHFAGAFNIPLVTIHGLTGPGTWAAMSNEMEIVWGKPGNCNVFCTYNTAINCKHIACLNSITVNKVLSTVYKLLQKSNIMKSNLKYLMNPEVHFTIDNKSIIIKKSNKELLLDFKLASEFDEFIRLIKEDLYKSNIKNESLIPIIKALIKEGFIFEIPS